MLQERLEGKPVSSFIVRFYPIEEQWSTCLSWKIKVTRVVNGEEVTFDKLEDVTAYMQQCLGE